ncbi:MAG: FAD-dependent oxidoreductase [Pseudomonadota bacterium]
MRIAIVGAGIAGMGAALAMAESHEVRLFEAEPRAGGHAHTVEVAFEDGTQPVDMGFIVFNAQNYPNICALFEHLEVPSRWSDMSFGFSLKGGRHEYACDSLDKLFAQRWRALDPRHVSGLREIRRFQTTAPALLERGALDGSALGDWLAAERYSDWFRDRFLLPMGGAIWSTSTRAMLAFPASNFVRFFVNHDLMTGLDPAQRWRTVEGGSIQYVRRLTARLGTRLVTGRRVAAVTPASGALSGGPATLRFADGGEERYDAVLLACHAPQARALIEAGGAPDPAQHAVLSRFSTSLNRAVLHGDTALMPRRRKVWSSWNFLSDGADADARRPAQVSYWMNRLQGIREDRLLVVSLNPMHDPDPALTHAEATWAHPLYDEAAFEGQRLMDGVQGRGGLWYAGAWLGYGFHEDGLRTGLRVAEALGARPAWARDTGQPLAPPVAAAAE